MIDVLTSVIAELLAQGQSMGEAARPGANLHAHTAAQHGERGMLASDLMPHLRRLLNPL